MPRTLKEKYAEQQLRLLRERIRRADDAILNENKVAQLLVEAMNEDDLKKVTAIIDKLRNVKRPELPKLKAAIEQAEAEINKYTGGGPLTAAWTKLKGLVGIDNPIVKVTTFASALEKGFSQIPTILKNNGVDLKNADLTKNLAATLGRLPATPTASTAAPTGAKTDQEMANTTFSTESHDIQEADDTPDAKIKTIASQLQKALSPAGIFGAFKKVPYIDSGALAAELVQAPLGVFADVAKTINQGAKAAEIAPDMADMIKGAGGAETKAASGSAPAVPAGQTQPTAPAAPTVGAANTKPAGETPNEPRGGGAAPTQQNISQAIDKVAKGSGVDKGNVTSVLRYLNQAGLIDKAKLAAH